MKVFPEMGVERDRAGGSRSQAEEPAAAMGRGERILVVEDQPEVMAYLAELLRTWGYEVYDAPEAQSALATLRRYPDIRLVVSDIGLPGGMDGLELGRAARAERRDLKFLFISGNPYDALSAAGLNASDIDLMTKPVRREELLTRIRRMLDAG